MSSIKRCCQSVSVFLVSLVFAGCAILPRSGPTKEDIYRSSCHHIPIIPLTFEIAATANAANPNTWLLRKYPHSPNYDTLGIGDKLDIRIWENATNGLYSRDTKGAAHIESLMISNQGTIFVPYIGRVTAAGVTLDALQRKLTAILKKKIIEPQVVINPVENLSKQVTIQGVVPKPGTFELKSGHHDLISLLAEAGGSTVAPELTEIMLERQGQTFTTTLLHVFQAKRYNLDLHPRDHIVVRAIESSFAVLGASGIQQLIKFPKSELSLIEALALARGLSDELANPSHVFLLRYEPPAVARQYFTQAHVAVTHATPVIYELNMRQMPAVFAAQRFVIKDRDLLIAVNAPYTNVRKILSSLSPAIALGRTTL